MSYNSDELYVILNKEDIENKAVYILPSVLYDSYESAKLVVEDNEEIVSLITSVLIISKSLKNN